MNNDNKSLKIRHIILMLGTLFLYQNGIALPYTNDNKNNRDSLKIENIIDLSDKLNIHFYGKSKLSSFAFRDKTTNNELLYEPNERLNIGFGFNYKFLGIGIAFNLHMINHDDDIYGKTERLDWNMNAYGRKSVIDFTFLHYKSFYLKNPGEVFNNWNLGDSNYIRPDLTLSNIGLAYTYNFNHDKFSYKAAFISNAIQKKSAGSFFLGGFINFYSIAGDSSFFPAASQFSKFPEVTSYGRASIGISFGYAYNFIIKKWFYISASIAMQPGIGNLEYKIDNVNEFVQKATSFNTMPRFAIGYNSLKWYAGFSTVSKVAIVNASHNTENLSVITRYGNYRFFIGKHFNVKR